MVRLVCLSRIILFTVGFFTAFAGENAAASDADSSVAGTPYVYKVGLPNVPGVMYRGEDGTPGGFSIELVQSILNDEQIPFVWVDGTWGELFDKVKNGEIDILPGTQVSKERMAYLDFLDNRFYTMWSELYISRGVKFYGLNDLHGQRIGLVHNDNNGIGFVDYVEDFGLDYTPVVFESHREAVNALLNHDIYAFAGPVQSMFGPMLEQVQSSGLFFNPSDLNVSFTKGKHPNIIKRVDARLNRYIIDQQSVYHQLISKYKLVHIEKSEQGIPPWLKLFLFSLFIVFVITVTFLLVLRHQVRIKTEQLRENELLMNKVLESGDMGVWGLDIRSQHYFWSKEIYSITGYSMEDIPDLNAHIAPSFHPEDRENVLKALALSIATGTSMDVEFRASAKDGSMVTLRAIGIVVKDNVGASVRILGICHDITKQKNHEQALLGALSKAEESERLKSAFLANMSHEIRTPLNAIVGFSSLLSSTQLLEKKRLVYSKIIVSQSSLLMTLINDIIDLAKIEAGVMLVKAEEEINIQAFITDIYTSHKLLCPEHLNFMLLVPSECKKIAIKVDEIRVRQIMSNFISNAFKYADPGDLALGVRLDGEKERMELFVRDCGPGIAPDLQASIFNRFRKLNQHSQGTGLGLAIAKSLADLHGGEVFLSSEVGVGSTFVLSLKL